ncbi:Thioredoxin [Evansella caseinilytica]|uniref:Thioredoxin n=1 Tax=Evansella caseinilytica TaxID=1503961 RepID=A0A1H3RUS0_9BACI|nr:thioredoxin family protein [Evansella caseinilytica]SDZ29058.1 Thioredoxin [Evansella caseinilytica]
MKELTSQEQLDEVIQGEGAVLMFSAGWCPDCVVIEPVLPEVEAAFSQFAFYKVDRDKFIEVCQKWDVLGIPSFIVFKNGKEVHRFVSKHRKTKAEITQFLTEAAEK